MISVDIGYKNMCVAFTENYTNYDVFLFEVCEK